MRFLTAEIPGTGGVVKERPEDFRVEEVPLYPLSGEGEHLCLKLEKRGITTHEMVARLARALGIRDGDVGFCGIKDAQAVAVQWVSVHRSAERALQRLDLAGVRLLEVTPHAHKLRIGHLAGNRFEILVRHPAPGAAARAAATLQTLARRGVPNAFGPQRFGTKQDGDRIGRALVSRDFEEALRWFLGAPSERERDSRVQEARRRFDEGRPDVQAWPPWMANERRVLATWLRTGDAHKALRRLPKSLRLLFVSAYQSRLFNRCLEARLDTLDRLLPGDVAVRHDTGGAFRVEDPAPEQPRADRFEISPSGPLFGPRLLRPAGEAAAIEDAVFQEEGLDPAGGEPPFRDVHLKGERRPYRIRLGEVELEELRDGLRLRFLLPRGSYATAVLAEVVKDPELLAVERRTTPASP